MLFQPEYNNPMPVGSWGAKTLKALKCSQLITAASSYRIQIHVLLLQGVGKIADDEWLFTQFSNQLMFLCTSFQATLCTLRMKGGQDSQISNWQQSNNDVDSQASRKSSKMECGLIIAVMPINFCNVLETAICCLVFAQTPRRDQSRFPTQPLQHLHYFKMIHLAIWSSNITSYSKRWNVSGTFFT